MREFSSKKYIAIAKGFKYLLFSLMVALVVLIASYIYSGGPVSVETKKGNISADSVSVSMDKNVAINPRFYSVDKDNKPYHIEAQKGTQYNNNKVLLEHVFAQYDMKDSGTVSLVGDEADMDTDKNTIDLVGNVAISLDEKYFLTSQKANLHYKESKASGQGNVELSSTFGKVSSEEFETEDGYEKIRFYGGRVKTIIYQQEGKRE